MKPVAEIGRIVANRCISPGTFELSVRAPRIAGGARAGQFVHVRCGSDFKPFLRRPLSVGPCRNDELKLIFIVRGEGTRLLSEMQSGDALDLIGPLGSNFSVVNGAGRQVLVAGGIGVVPLLLFDDQALKDKDRLFLLGVRSGSFLTVPPEEITRRGIEISSDDGSIGFKGNVVSLLEDKLMESGDVPVQIFACGPGPMMAVLKDFCKRRNVGAQVSLEVPMGCGIGACQSCAVPRSDGGGYLLVCRDGPVFDIRDVDLTPGSVL